MYFPCQINLTLGERPNKKNIESLNWTRKVNILRLWRGNYLICFSATNFILENLRSNLDRYTKFLYLEQRLELFLKIIQAMVPGLMVKKLVNITWF